jgi:bifunctional non-homologous end joining protein LigD
VLCSLAIKSGSKVHLRVKEAEAAGNRGVPIPELAGEACWAWGAGLTAAKMAECRWLKPVTVAQFEFVEWTSDAHLRHSRFVELRDDKKAKDVKRE